MSIPRRRGWIYLLLLLLTCVNYMDRSALSVAIKPISTEFHLNASTSGVVLSAFLWLYLVALIPAGLLTDRIGSRRIQALSIVVWSLATMAVSVVAGFATLLVARMLMGVGESPTYPANGRVVQEWAPARERGRATAIYNAGAYAGPAIGSILAATLVTHYGWRLMFVVMGLVGFLWLIAWLIWFRDPAQARWLGGAERDMILRERGLAQLENQPGERPRTSLRTVLDLLRYRSMWGVALIQSAAVYTQYLFLTWLPNYLEQAHHLSVLKSGSLSAVPYAAAVVLGILLGLVSDRLLSARAVAAGVRRYAVAGLLLVSAVVLLTPFVASVALIMVLISVSLTCVSTAVSLNLALLGDLLRAPERAGQANGIAMIGGNVFGLAAPIVTGVLVQATQSYTSAFVVAGVLLLAGTTVALTMTRRPIADRPTAVPPAGPVAGGLSGIASAAPAGGE
jgi:MFS family permease